MDTQTDATKTNGHSPPSIGADSDESPTLGALFAALAKAQGEMRHASKTNNNPFFKSKYASLADVREAVREPLAKNALTVLQPVSNAIGGVIVTTILGHASGEWIRSRLFVPAKENTAQGLGSATTYGLRYSLMAMVGIAADEDDDGNEASVPANGARYTPKAESPKQSRTEELKGKIQAKQAGGPSPHDRIKKLLDEAGLVLPEARFELVKEATGKTKPKELTDEDVARVLQHIVDMRAQG